jgi:hypothetical protein
MEALGNMTKRAVDLHLLEGFSVGNGGPSISYLQFADDSIFFCDASPGALKNIFLCFAGPELEIYGGKRRGRPRGSRSAKFNKGSGLKEKPCYIVRNHDLSAYACMLARYSFKTFKR